MGRYLDASMVPGEKILREEQVSKKTLIVPGFLALVVLVLMMSVDLVLGFWGGLFFGGMIVFGGWIRIWMTEMALTDKRVVAKVGIVFRDAIDINIRRVESVQVEQSIPGRLFNYGTIILGGAGIPQVAIAGIDNPLEFRKAFYEFQESRFGS